MIRIKANIFISPISSMSDEGLIDELIHCMKDKEIYDNTITLPYPYSKDDASHFLNEAVKNQNIWFIFEENDGIIGTIDLRLERFAHSGMIGYWLAKPYWSKGIMTEAVSQFVKSHCFEKLGLDKVTANCLENNIGSARVLEKAGFKQEGLFINHYKKDGKFYNAKAFGKCR